MRFSLLVLMALLGMSMAINNLVFQNNTRYYNATQVQYLFKKFKADFKKFYNVIEEVKRFETFRNNLDVIGYLNENEDGSAEYGVN